MILEWFNVKVLGGGEGVLCDGTNRTEKTAKKTGPQ